MYSMTSYNQALKSERKRRVSSLPKGKETSSPHESLFQSRKHFSSNLTGQKKVLWEFCNTIGKVQSTRNTFPSQTSFRNEGERKIFPDKQKLRVYLQQTCSSETLKQILQTEKHWWVEKNIDGIFHGRNDYTSKFKMLQYCKYNV